MASRTINIPATTNLDADELTSGTVPFARLPTGTGSAQVAVGNDGRFTDTRTPTDGSVTAAKFATGVLDTDSTMAADSDTRVPSQKAVKAALAGKAASVRTVGAGLGTSGTVNLDMASVHGTIQTIAASGAITFTTSNRSAGREVTLIISAGASNRTLAWPSWLTVGAAAMPTTLISGKTLVATVTCIDTTDAAAVATFAVQP